MGLLDFKPKKRKEKKGVVKSKAKSGCRGTIFRLLNIHSRITDETNGEMYTLFREVCWTLNQKHTKKGGHEI